MTLKTTRIALDEQGVLARKVLLSLSFIRNIEKEIGKEFVKAEIPSAEEICKKQLYKVMDQIVKTDVDDEEIAPFMQDINRYFEYIDKEELIKKIVSKR